VSDLLRRNAALEQTARQFRKKSLDFRTADCMRMARAHLVAMGHQPPPMPCYSSLAGARRALKKMGFKSIEGLLAGLLERIPPALVLPGDLVVLRGEVDGEEVDLESIAIAMGQGKYLGWYDGRCLTLTRVAEFRAAFRA